MRLMSRRRWGGWRGIIGWVNRPEPRLTSRIYVANMNRRPDVRHLHLGFLSFLLNVEDSG
jgi:hypothetical protein